MEKAQMYPYGSPQEGMEENFKADLSAAQKLIMSAYETLRAKPDLASLEARVALTEARLFCKLVLGEKCPPYTIEGVTRMLVTGRRLEEVAFPPEVAGLVGEAVAAWREAIVEFPMPRRLGKVVEWATRPMLRELFGHTV